MPTLRPLRHALLANALFSLVTGTLLLVAPVSVAGLLGGAAPHVLQGLGAALTLFATGVGILAAHPRAATWHALMVTVLDVVWVVASVVSLLAFPGALSSTGVAWVAGVAAIVAGLAAWQLVAIDRAHRVPGSRARRVCVEVQADAPPEAMWRVVRELGEIDRYMPTLAHAEIVAGEAPGVGAVRRCVDRAGNAWSEACIAFEPERRLVLRFDAGEPGFPFPVSEMTGGWTLSPAGEGSDVAVWWELTPEPRLAAPILLPAFAYRAGRDVPGLVQRMATAANGRAPDPAAAAAPRKRGLRARFC